MTTGTIPAAYQPHPLTAPTAKVAFIHVDGESQARDPLAGHLHGTGLQVLQQLVSFINGMVRVFPCSATGTNTISLIANSVSPQIGFIGAVGTNAGYVDYDVFSAVAANTSTGPVSAAVTTAASTNAAARTLATLKVFKTNGSARADNGDITAGLHYTFTFVDSLDSGNGGFVLR